MFKIGEEIFRMLKPNGLSLHIEQPQYSDKMPLSEQFIRDWDAFNNNEPFWGASEVTVLNERLDTIERLFSCKISFIRFKLRLLYLILDKRRNVNVGTHYNCKSTKNCSTTA